MPTNIDEKNINAKSSIIYNVDLYTIKSSNIPFYVDAEEFEKTFKFFHNIFVTMPDNEHVKEIRTGLILPIVNLDKGYSRDEPNINNNTDSDDNYALFAIRYKKKLIAHEMDLNQLLDYYKKEKTYIENLIKCQQMTEHTLNSSKMLKKSKNISAK